LGREGFDFGGTWRECVRVDLVFLFLVGSESIDFLEMEMGHIDFPKTTTQHSLFPRFYHLSAQNHAFLIILLPPSISAFNFSSVKNSLYK